LPASLPGQTFAHVSRSRTTLEPPESPDQGAGTPPLWPSRLGSVAAIGAVAVAQARSDVPERPQVARFVLSN
jgi:hypothetical protein